MTQIIVARHGETEWNVSEIFRGRPGCLAEERFIDTQELLNKERAEPVVG